uniref:Uncharacterized protein n=1 Tax=Rhizophora mucronata TaxID=61149 RepID=A0A2P2QPY7_RHIMU
MILLIHEILLRVKSRFSINFPWDTFLNQKLSLLYQGGRALCLWCYGVGQVSPSYMFGHVKMGLFYPFPFHYPTSLNNMQ